MSLEYLNDTYQHSGCFRKYVQHCIPYQFHIQALLSLEIKNSIIIKECL